MMTGAEAAGFSRIDPERFGELLYAHPLTSPDDLGELEYLIDPPFSLAPTSSFILFRDLTLLPMMETRPNDPNLPKFLRAVEDVLRWRDSIAPHERFWKADAVT